MLYTGKAYVISELDGFTGLTYVLLRLVVIAL